LRKILLIAFLAMCIPFFLSIIAESADWIPVAESKSYVFFVDKESIKFVSSNVVGAWTKTLYKKPERNRSKLGNYYLLLYECDCREKRKRILQSSIYYTDGTSESFNSPDDKWNCIEPDTVVEIIYKYVCR
jgi:hypothetical protein